MTRRSGDSRPSRAETIERQPSDDVLTESLTLAASDVYSQAGGDCGLVSLVVEDPVTSRELLRLGHAAEATIVVSPRVLQGLVSDRENAGEAFLRGRLRLIGNPIRGLEFCQRFARAAAHGRRSSPSVLG